jgi:hypothetical protein
MRMVKSLTVLWRNRRPAVHSVAWGAALVILTAAALIVVVFLAVTPTAKERQACDQAVATVLTTKDPLELERAMFLVQAEGLQDPQPALKAARASAQVHDLRDRALDLHDGMTLSSFLGRRPR